MPIYEYECDKCHRRVSVLTTRISEKAEPLCEYCGSKKLSRLMSRFAMPRSDDARLDSLGDPSTFGDFDEKDPKSVARVMRRLGKEMGEEIGGPELDEAIEEIERDDPGAGRDDDSSGGSSSGGGFSGGDDL